MRTLALSLFLCALLAACGDRPTDDLERSPAEVEKEAAEMDTGDLEKVIEEYKAAIEAKQKEFEELFEEFKSKPPTEMLGEKAKELKATMDRITAELKKLAERQQIYAAQLAKQR